MTSLANPVPDLSLPAMLRRIALFTRSWPGVPLDDAATVRGINPSGSAVPVFWCFNAEEEFASLSAAMGPHQPMAGMRSLNQIMEVSPRTRPVLDEVARHYAATLLASFGNGPCIVGGNCQAAGIAWRVAMHLWLAGVPVLRLVTLDADLRVPFPGHVRLLFGAESTAHNPFLSSPGSPCSSPWHWRRAYGGSDWLSIPGGHGQYFSAAALSVLAAAIPRPHAPLPQRTSVAPLSWKILGRETCGWMIEAVLPATLSDMPELAVLPVWHSAKGGLVHHPAADWIVPVQREEIGGAHILRAQIMHPGAEAVRLVPVLCAEGKGPLDWP